MAYTEYTGDSLALVGSSLPSTPIPPIELITQHIAANSKRYAGYKKYREMYDGDHDVVLTDRMRTFLNVESDEEFHANYCPLVVDELARRLCVIGFDAEDSDANALIEQAWDDNDMAAVHKDVQTTAIRDGDSFIIVEPFEDGVAISHNLAFDGSSGVDVIYQDNKQTPSLAFKRWTTLGDDGTAIERMNIYTQLGIHRLVFTKGKWVAVVDSYGAFIDGSTIERREPGLNVVHMRFNANGSLYGTSILSSVIPLQKALNKSVVDLLAAADTTGFRIFIMLGGKPVDEEGNPIEVAPGQFIYSAKNPGEFDVKAIPGENLRPLIEVVDAFKISIAQVTETPLSLFQVSGQMASEGTQKQQENPLVSKTEDVSVYFGTTYSQLAKLVLRILGNPRGYDRQRVRTIWDEFEVRDSEERTLTKVEAYVKLVDAGVDRKNAAIVAGFNEDDAALLGTIELGELALEMEKIE